MTSTIIRPRGKSRPRLWHRYGRCGDCHQEYGRPCLNLRPVSPALYRSEPHPNRPGWERS